MDKDVKALLIPILGAILNIVNLELKNAKGLSLLEYEVKVLKLRLELARLTSELTVMEESAKKPR